jgi:hypothetical protein
VVEDRVAEELEALIGAFGGGARRGGVADRLAQQIPVRETVAERARGEGRWLLTRDHELAAVGPRTLLVRSEDVESQLVEVFGRLGLCPSAGLDGSRCSECNGELTAAGRDDVRELVPPYVLATAERFRRCGGCGRVYWPGTHTERILQTMAAIVQRLEASGGRS